MIANDIRNFLKKFIIICSFVVLGSVPLFAEQEWSFRISPEYSGVVGVPNFGSGFGAQADIDWSFLSFRKNTIRLGLSAGAGIGSISITDGSTFSILEGGLGPFVRWRLMDRLSVGADISFGAYQYQWNDNKNGRPRIDSMISAQFHLSPYIALFAQGGYAWHAFTAASPLNTLTASVGVTLNLSEILRPQTRLVGETAEVQRIFPVSFAWYEHNKIARVRIINNETNTITGLHFSFLLERYMNQASEFAVIDKLAPGETQEIAVTALFNESMLNLTENVNANAHILIDYSSLGARKQAALPVPMTVYQRNTMSWDDDKRAASFVSARDPAAVLFANYTASALRRYKADNPDKFRGIPENIILAAGLFEALNLYGINYVIDPSSSYIDLSENASSLDSLNYPYQTLYYRGGDCDDLSILYCSLLEVLGIDTAFITIPGHIYMAFDIGVTNEESRVKSSSLQIPNSTLLIEHEGKLWMPVEITLPHGGFSAAWRTGIQEWSQSRSLSTRAIYPMQTSWASYQPVSVPGAGDRLPSMPGETELIRAAENSLNEFIRIK
jgi:hypothetical protein